MPNIRVVVQEDADEEEKTTPQLVSTSALSGKVKCNICGKEISAKSNMKTHQSTAQCLAKKSTRPNKF